MATGDGKSLNAQLFIEGRQVPFNAANCSFKAGQPSTASITMVPIREINHVLPRTMVHLFVKDHTFNGAYKPWVLLFEGEVYGYGGSKNAESRAATLFCMGLTNYWDNAKQFHVNMKTSDGNSLALYTLTKGLNEAKEQNVGLSQSESGVRAYFTRVLDGALKKDKDFIGALMECLKAVTNVNSFFKYADARYRINDRITFQSSGKIEELIDFANKSNFFDSVIGRGNGGQVTVRQIINSLMDLVFHDFVSVPAPSRVYKEGLGKKTSNTGSTFVTQLQGENIVTQRVGIGKDHNQTIGSFIFKPNTFILPPPKCNVLFPDHYDTFQFSRTFFHEITRLKIQPMVSAGMDALGLGGEARVFQGSFFAPSGYDKFQTGNESNETVGDQEMLEGPDGQGKKGDPSEGVTETSNTLQDFNYVSHEEILKGIFPELGNAMPSATVFAKTTALEDQNTYYQRGANFLYHKKRLAARNVTVSGPFNISPVPGFPMLVLDDSEGEQHVVGTLESISHRVSASSGAYTTYQMSFARYVEELDMWTGEAYEPPIPPWYDAEIFGKRRPIKDADWKSLPKSQQSRVKDLGKINAYATDDENKLSDYYQGLLGESKSNSHLGSSPITSRRNQGLLAATLDMLNQYRAAKKSDSLNTFINVQTRRDYVPLDECFEFLGADNARFKKTPQSNPTFYKDLTGLVFKGDHFDGGFIDLVEEVNVRDSLLSSYFGKDSLDRRRKPIDNYRNRLNKERGFRG